MSNKKFNEDFRKMVVDLYSSGQTVRDLSSEYGVSEVTIYKWIKRYSPMDIADGTTVTPDDFVKLKKQMLRLQEENEIFKKGYGHIRQKVSLTELSNVINQHKDQYPIQTLCEVLEIPRSTYYQSTDIVECSRVRENKELTEGIREIHAESKQRYGAPKIHFLLKQEGYLVSLKRVQRLMKKAGMRAITQKKYRPQVSKHQVEARDNLLNRDISTTTINEKWVADITYIHTLRDGWCYLASVLDLQTKKVVGYSFSRTMTTELVTKAFDNAFETQQPAEGLVLHTDLGSQYSSEDFRNHVQSKGVKQSFSHKGCPYDNACIESFHAILKKEEVHHVTYVDYASAKIALFQYIEGWYNRKRIHSSLGYKTPQAIEDQIRQIA
ncbi:IS3 family transposase [Bacillus methanolicus]|uniref:IS3 family transposase n=1 Tax=Bacillus methanolicus TaxID=1471 RepID=UPI00238058FC|nr:IS3 family transposase [Bacillus methanolicus]MDE3839051.1 IS3 family transposase [Bacillus methanolicus]